MKKILSIILCVLLAFGPAFAVFAEGEEAAPETAEAAAAPAEDLVLRAGGGKVLTVAADGASLTMADYAAGDRAQIWRISGQTVYNRINNRAITVDGGVVLAANKGLDTQRFTLNGDGLLAYAGGGFLAVGDDENLFISQDGTVWEALTPDEMEGESQVAGPQAPPVKVGGTMVLLLDGTADALTVGDDNVSLTTAAYNMSAEGQFWSFSPNGTAFNIKSTETDTYVDVSGSSLNPGGQLILWRGTGGDNQKWEVEQENGRCYVRSVLSGLYMTAQNGAVTQQSKENASAWRLMSADDVNTAFLSGTGNSAAFENRVRLLKNLGVIDGGRIFAESGTVTNRDAVTAAVRLVTGGDEFAPGATGFEDVDPTDAVSGYVLQAVNMDIWPSGVRFYPDYAARADDLIAALVKGLGMDFMANGGYMGTAGRIGLLKGVSAFEDNTLTYSQFFRLLTNALSVQMPDATYTYNGVNYRLDGERTFISNFWDVTVLTKAEILDVDYGKGRLTAVCGDEKYELVLPDSYSNVELRGLTAEIWFDSEDVALNIDVYSGNSVAYGYITAVNGVEDTDAVFDPGLVSNFSLNYASGKWRTASGVRITVDGGDYYDSVAMVNAFVRLVSRKGRVERMDIYRMKEGGLLREYDGDTLTYLQGERSKAILRGISYKDRVEVVLNGRPAALDEIPYNAVVDFCDNGDFLLVAASVNTVTGDISVSDGTLYDIGGVTYEMTNPFGHTYCSSDMGETYSEDETVRRNVLRGEVTAYIDLSGSVRYIRGSKNKSTFIGVIANIDAGKFGGKVDRINSVTLFSDRTGTMTNEIFTLDLTKSSELTEDDLIALYNDTNRRENTVYEFRVSGGEIKSVTELDWLECSDNAKNNVSAQVRGALVETYGQERVDELFDDPHVFITGWTMGRDYGLGRINFQARTDAGDDYSLVCDGGAPTYVLAYDVDNKYSPSQISWNDYRNINFDRSFLKVGFLKDNRERLKPDIVYIFSEDRNAVVSSWDVHGVVKAIRENYDDRDNVTYTVDLLEPGGAVNSYTVEREEDLVGSLDGSRPKRGSAVTLSVHGSYEKVYYNTYGEIITDEEAWALEDAGDYVELREVYNSNGYANVAKVWDMPNEIGRFNNEYSVTYVDNIYKIDGNLMYYRDSSSGAIQPYYSTGGSMFIIEDASHYLMFDYDDFRRGYTDEPITLDDISTEASGGESDKLLIFSVSRGRYPKIIVRMPSDWEP